MKTKKPQAFFASKLNFFWSTFFSFVLMSFLFSPAIHAQVPADVPWATPNGSILQPGQAFGTCHVTEYITNPNDRYVFAVWDTRSLPANFSDVGGSPYAHLWNPQAYHHSSWTLQKLGNVFGTTIDGEGNIYLAAIGQTGWSAANSIPGFGALGGYDSSDPTSTASVAAGGKVYKIDGITGIPQVFATLPQQKMSNPENGFHAPGLGQIAYDSAHHQLFVSNFEDGKIYRLSMSGALIDHFDPNSADTGAPGRVADSELVWALALGPGGGRLYFSVNSTNVRSIVLDSSTGGFALADENEFSVDPQANITSLPAKISDLAFSTDGKDLLVAMRNTDGLFAEAYNHNSISFLYRWQPSGAYSLIRNIQVGDDREGYGGTAFGPLSVDPNTGTVTGSDQMLWFSSADILNGAGPHGLEAVPIANLQFLAGEAGGLPSPINGAGNSSQSLYTNHRGKIYAIDYDGNFTLDTKGTGGEIDIMGGGLEGNKSCLRTKNVRSQCLTDGSGDVSVSFDIVNLTPDPIYHVFLVDLPAGVTTADDHFHFPAGIPSNGTASVGPIRFHNAPPGPLSFTISIHDASLMECCSSRVIIDIPDCSCGQIVTDKNVCIFGFPTKFNYTFTFQDLLPGISAPHVFVVPISPANITLTPNVFPASPPLQYGDQLTGTTQISGSGAKPGQQVCLRISTHDALFRECCAIDRCFTLRNCIDFPIWNDFDINVVWRDSTGNTGSGRPVRLTDDSAYFWFFSEDNVELAVKILDGRAINGNWWFFYGALSDVEYTITLTDKTTGASKSYFNPAGTLASVGDIAALPGSGANLASSIGNSPGTFVPSSTSTCTNSATSLCLDNGRFEVTAAWKDFTGTSGSAQAVPLTNSAGYFWFFGANNVELVLKVLDGRHLNGHWWVFFGALSNVEYTLTVRDTVTGAVKVYSNPSGTFASTADMEAFQ